MPLTGRVPPRASDPWRAGLVALAVYSLHGFEGTLDRDQGTFVYAGQQVARGVPPYAGIFNTVGPVGDLVTGSGIRVGRVLGLDDVLAARLTYLLVSAAAVGVLSVLAREAWRSRAAGLLVPAVFLTFAEFLDLAGNGPREKTVMVLLLELALLLMLRRRWLGAGVLTALATLTWQPVIFPAAVSAVVALLTVPGPRLRAAAAYVVGGLAPTVLAASAFAVSGHLRLAWWGFVVVNVGYTTQPTIVDSWRLITHDYRLSLVLVVAGWALAVALGASQMGAATRSPRSPRSHSLSVRRAALVLGAGALVAGLWSCLAINGGADLFVVLPFAALGLGRALLLLAGRVSPAGPRTVAALCVLAVVGAGVEAVTTRDSRLPTERRDVDRMVAAVPPGSTVLSINAAEVLVLASRRNPTPWQLSTSATAPFLDDHLPGGLRGYARRISAQRPALIAVGRHSVDFWLRPLLLRRYARVGAGDHWAWWASRTLGPATLKRLRATNAATWGR